MIILCTVINIPLILLFIASAIVWDQQQNRAAAITCLSTGIVLVISVPTLLYRLLTRRNRVGVVS